MADERAGRYQEYYQAEFTLAKQVLQEANAVGNLFWGVHNYEAFIFQGKSVRLIFYPHRTCTGARPPYIRVRDQGSKDIGEAFRLLQLLALSVHRNPKLSSNTFTRCAKTEKRKQRGV